MLCILLPLAEAFCVRWNDERSLTATFERRVNCCNHNVHVCNATVGDPCLGAVEYPFIFCFVVNGTCAQARNVGTCIGFTHTKCSKLHVVCIAVALWHPLHQLLWCAVAGDTRGCKTRTHDGHTDTCVAPKQFFNADWHRQPSGVGHVVHEELPAVQTDFCGLLYNGPRELFALVPLLGGGTNDVFCEGADPLLNLELVVIELEGEISHAYKLPSSRA